MDVKKIRTELALTQEQLAQRLGVAFSTVNRWERGKTKPSKIAEKLLSELVAKPAGS